MKRICALLGHRIEPCLSWDHTPYGEFAYLTIRCKRGDADPPGYVP